MARASPFPMPLMYGMAGMGNMVTALCTEWWRVCASLLVNRAVEHRYAVCRVGSVITRAATCTIGGVTVVSVGAMIAATTAAARVCATDYVTSSTMRFVYACVRVCACV